MSRDNGHRALVTGAGRRLGRSIALGLAEAGFDVVVHHGASAVEAQETASVVRELGRDAWVLGADLADAAQVEALVTEATEAAGQLSVLVNSASIFPGDSINRLTWESLEANFRINAFSPLVLARNFAASVEEGCVVNILDSRINSYDKDHAAYHLSKRALHTITAMLAIELAPGCRVNAVAPGLILPPEGEDEDYMVRREAELPLGRRGCPEDVARAVAFLVGNNFITGQTIYVDGGRHLEGGPYG